MQADRFDFNLKAALGDKPGRFYDVDMRKTAIGEAVKAYSQYKPLKRRYGYGTLVSDLESGKNNPTALGGPYYVGDSVKLDAFSPIAETFTITAVDIATGDDLFLAGDAYALSLSGNTVHKHRGGCVITKSVAGLQLVAGQDTYLLPTDFIAADQATFDIAIGARVSQVRQGGFYDSVSQMAAQYEQGGRFGSNQNYIGNAFGYGVDPNTQYPGLQIGGEITYFFELGNPPTLRVTPAPPAAKVLDFQYNANQSLATLPESVSGHLLIYARWHCVQARASFFAARLDYSEDDIHETGTANANALQKLADCLLDEWNKRVRNRPFALSG